jgi:hypothetical protein
MAQSVTRQSWNAMSLHSSVQIFAMRPHQQLAPLDP